MSGLAYAIYTTLSDDTGLKCPYGCKGCSARWWGLVSHLVERHGYKQKKAEKVALKVMYPWNGS